MPFPNSSQQLLFPDLLHNLLEDCDKHDESNIISWSPKGNAFKVHNKEAFTHSILPRYFRQSKYKSFARQLNIWGFLCVTSGSEKGHYFHKHFLRGKPEVSRMMKRGTKKTLQLTNVLSSVGGSAPRLVVPFLDDASTGTTSTPRSIITSFFEEEDHYESMAVLDGDQHHCPHKGCSFPIPARTNKIPPRCKKEEATRTFLEDQETPYTRNQRRRSFSQSSCLEVSSVSQVKREAKFLVQPLLYHEADATTESDAFFAINGPMEDWLSCLEKLFDAPCHHAKQRGQGESFQEVKKSKPYNHNFTDKSWLSSLDFGLEPRPLRRSGGW